MEGVAHGMKPRSGKGPTPAVAKEFVAADKGRDIKTLPKKKSKVKTPKSSPVLGGGY